MEEMEELCTPSTLAASSTANGDTYECMLAINSGYTLHWTTDEASGLVSFAAEAATGGGWVALGFPTNGGSMGGSEVVMGSPGDVKMYNLPGYSPGGGWPETTIPGVVPESMAVTQTSTTVLEFQRMVAGDFTLSDDPRFLIAAYHTTSLSHTAKHPPGTYSPFEWTALGAVEPNACPPKSPNYALWITHGALMALGWGVLLPVGVMAARTLKDKDPLWFHIHRACNYAGLLAALIAWIIALANLGPINFGEAGDELASSHSVIGMIVMILAILQPINAFVRPHNGDNKRTMWNYVHWTCGRVAWIGGIVNVFIGIFLFKDRDSCSGNWPVILFALWIGFYISAFCYLEFRAYCKRKNMPVVKQTKGLEADQES